MDRLEIQQTNSSFGDSKERMKKSQERALHLRSKRPESRIPFNENNTGILLSAILIAALVVRIIALISFSRSLYGGFLIWDERTYHDWAIHIIRGSSYSVPDFGPLAAYIMAAVYKLFAPDPIYVRALNILFSVLTCLFIYLIGKNLANKSAGLLACLMAALYKPFIFFSILILKESLVLLLFSVAIWSFACLLQKVDRQSIDTQRTELRVSASKYGMLFILGAAGGGLINVRQNIIVLIPVFLFFLVWREYKRAFSLKECMRQTAVCVIGLIFSTVPFLIHNYHASGEWKLYPPGGFNLYLGNTLETSYPYYRPVAFASSIPRVQGVQFIIEASRRAGKKLTPDEASSYWNREVLHIAGANPAKFAWKLWQKTLVILNQFEEEDNYGLGFISRFVPFFEFPFFSFWFIAPFGIAALSLSVAWSYRACAFSAIAAVYSLTLILFFSNMRIRIPLLVILIPYAAIGLQMLFRASKEGLTKMRIRSYLIVAAIMGVIEFLPVTGTGDISAHYNTHAALLASKGMRNEAIQYWEASSAMERPYSAYANLSLAALYFSAGAKEEGNRYLDKIPDTSFAAAAKYELLGDNYAKQGHIDEAIAAYEHSLQINFGQLSPRPKLLRLYDFKNPELAQKIRTEQDYIKSFYPTER
jgi:4-amino-4-deoxy-L-arabinose transferase-like glycosyltransferase